MIVAPLQFDPVTALRSQADRDAVRSPGLHVSRIFYDIEDTLNRKNRTMEQSMLDAYRAMGFLWEYALVKALDNDELLRVGEVERDGIILSPDFFDFNEFCVVEGKATYRSFRKMGEDGGGLRGEFWVWDVQMKAYCHAMETTQARLVAAFVNGDYRTYGPAYRSWKITYTSQELVENWNMLKAHARTRGWLPNANSKR